MDRKASISAISYYLPVTKLNNKNINDDFPDWSIDKISKKTGIKNRFIAAENEYSSDMAVKAANKLFEENSIERDKIDFILLCTQSPDYLLPTTACILQDRLGIPTTAGALDFNLGCSGYVYGLSLAKGLISSQTGNNILLLTAETYSKYIHPADKNNRVIFGDGAAATLITHRNGMCEIGDFAFGTNGKGAENLIIKAGGMRNKKGAQAEDNYLFMNGKEIFNFALTILPLLVKSLIEKAHLKLSEIDLFIFHQANKLLLETIREELCIPIEKFYFFLEDCGNTVSSTIPIALREALIEKRINKGNKVLLAGFGVGYSWGGTILSF